MGGLLNLFRKAQLQNGSKLSLQGESMNRHLGRLSTVLSFAHRAVVSWAISLAIFQLCGFAQSSSIPQSIANPTAIPQWFQTGRYRSARWDGGPIEAEKGVLTNWVNYTEDDPRQVLQATRDWYNPKTIDLLTMAHLNWAWVTWSVGFSPATEKKQQELVSHYIKECHQNHIRVAAYISVGNMFWKDMFEHVPGSIRWVLRDFQGGPVFYTRPNRYMADIQNPEWINLQKERVLSAVQAGADALWIDNTFSYHGEENVARLIGTLYDVAVPVNPQFVIMSNYNRDVYTWAKLQNGVTTEDGREPGYYTDKHTPYLVTNAGLLRYNYGVSEGWRPVSMEYGERHYGDRMTTPLKPRKWQLAIAEAAMYHASFEVYSEGLLLRDLYFGDSRALEGWRAIGAYNAFLEKNGSYYTNPHTVAPVAILCDSTDFAVSYLNQLSEHNLNYDVIFNYQAPQEDLLRRYRVVVLPNTNPLSPEWCAALSRWVQDDGGALISVQDTSLFSPGPAAANQDFGLGALLRISRQSIPESKQVRSRGRGSVTYLPDLPPAGEMLSLIQSNLKQPELVEVEPQEATLSNAAFQPEYHRVILHLLNYRQDLRKELHLRVHAAVRKIEILSPDPIGNTPAQIQVHGQEAEIVVPELQTYDLVAIYLVAGTDATPGAR